MQHFFRSKIAKGGTLRWKIFFSSATCQYEYQMLCINANKHIIKRKNEKVMCVWFKDHTCVNNIQIPISGWLFILHIVVFSKKDWLNITGFTLHKNVFWQKILYFLKAGTILQPKTDGREIIYRNLFWPTLQTSICMNAKITKY